MCHYLNKLETHHTEARGQPPRTFALSPSNMMEEYRIHPFVQAGNALSTSPLQTQYVCAIVNTSQGFEAGEHWICYYARFNHAKRTFRVRLFNSLGVDNSRDDNVCRRLAILFTDRASPAPYVQSGTVVNVTCPQQNNGCDCGVFALANAFYLFEDPETAFGLTTPYSQADIPRFRLLMAQKILQNAVLGV